MTTTTDSDGIVPGESGEMGSGYGSGSTFINLSQIQLYVRSSDVTRRVWHPPTLAVPEIPALPPTPTVINRILNAGWNASARSIAPLAASNCFLFTAATGVSGAFLGIGNENRDGMPLSFFSHALVCDRNGVHVHENGVLVTTLKNRQYAESLLRICKHADGHIVFVVTTGTETVVYTSATPISLVYPQYIYGMLYSSGDQVMSAAFNSGEVMYGAI